MGLRILSKTEKGITRTDNLNIRDGGGQLSLFVLLIFHIVNGDGSLTRPRISFYFQTFDEPAAHL